MKPARIARPRDLALYLCFDRLRTRGDWLESWLIGWGLLLVWGAFAFFVFPPVAAIPAQAVFFTGLFPWILLPVFSAAGPQPCGRR